MIFQTVSSCFAAECTPPQESCFIPFTAVPPKRISAAPFVDYKVDLLDERSFDTAGIYTTDNRVYRSTDGRISAVMAEESYNELFAQCGADSGTSSIAVSDGSEIIVYSRTISANAAVGMEEQAEVYMNNHFYNSYSNNLSDMNLSYALLSMIKQQAMR